jgi:hypothetical protein
MADTTDLASRRRSKSYRKLAHDAREDAANFAAQLVRGLSVGVYNGMVRVPSLTLNF